MISNTYDFLKKETAASYVVAAAVIVVTNIIRANYINGPCGLFRIYGLGLLIHSAYASK